MKTDELKTLIKAAEGLGHRNIRICLNDSRDGTAAYPSAVADLRQVGPVQDREVILVVSHGN